MFVSFLALRKEGVMPEKSEFLSPSPSTKTKGGASRLITTCVASTAEAGHSKKKSGSQRNAQHQRASQSSQKRCPTSNNSKYYIYIYIRTVCAVVASDMIIYSSTLGYWRDAELEKVRMHGM